jgi:hypothetical protein
VSNHPIAKGGTVIGTRHKINLIEGANVTITVTDDAANGENDVTIASTGGGAGVPGDSVVTETSYSQAAGAGASTDYSRKDHTHGSVAPPAHADVTGVSADQHHNKAHVAATNLGLGGDHTISGAAAGQVLRASSDVAANFQQLAFSDLSGAATTAQITDAAVTYAKIQDVSAASKLLGRGSAAGAGDVQEITLGTNLTMSGTTLNGGAGAMGTDPLWVAKGDTAAATGVAAGVRIPVGTNNQVLTADSAEAAGVKWANVPTGTGSVATDAIWVNKGDTVAATATAAAVRVPVGANDTMLVADSAQAAGVKWTSALLPESVEITGGPLALRGVITPAQITASQNDYNPTGLADATTLRLSADAHRQITGLQGGATGRILILQNIGSGAALNLGSIELVNQSASSVAAYRFSFPASTNIKIPPQGVVALQYDSSTSRWRLFDRRPTTHEAYVDDFGATGDGTTDDIAAFNAAVAALPATGGKLILGPKTYKLNSTWTISKSVWVQGQGSGPSGTGEGTRLLFAPNITGVIFGGDGTGGAAYFTRWSSVFLEVTAATTSGNGIEFRGAARSYLEHVFVKNFGGDGFYFSGSAAHDQNHSTVLVKCTAINNDGNGFSTNGGGRNNQLTFVGCASLTNNIGFYDNGSHNTYISPHCEYNVTDDYKMEGGSGYFLQPYSEGGGNARFTGTWYTWEQPGNYALSTLIFEGSSRASCLVRQYNGFSTLGLRVYDYAGRATREWALSSASTGEISFNDIGNTGTVWRVLTSDNALRVASRDLQLETAGSDLLMTSGFIENGEIADPTAPAANKARLYVRDNGSGKTQLAVRFPTGAVQVLATEP